MQWLDKFGEAFARNIAHTSSRRSVLCSIGKTLVGTAFIMPVLPVARTARAETPAPGLDDATEKELSSCDYWRYCAVDGFLCTCCGGSATTCPPGSEPSPISWVGTCHNPKDGKDYLVSYHDCCGKTACDRCYCGGQVRERPGYELFLHNDVNWCMANANTVYHCTVSIIVGLGKN
jgi:aralkylamine dehydrogenase light chain/methylamine dehydrogenase light chain